MHTSSTNAQHCHAHWRRMLPGRGRWRPPTIPNAEAPSSHASAARTQRDHCAAPLRHPSNTPMRHSNHRWGPTQPPAMTTTAEPLVLRYVMRAAPDPTHRDATSRTNSHTAWADAARQRAPCALPSHAHVWHCRCTCNHHRNLLLSCCQRHGAVTVHVSRHAHAGPAMSRARYAKTGGGGAIKSWQRLLWRRGGAITWSLRSAPPPHMAILRLWAMSPTTHCAKCRQRAQPTPSENNKLPNAHLELAPYTMLAGHTGTDEDVSRMSRDTPAPLALPPHHSQPLCQYLRATGATSMLGHMQWSPRSAAGNWRASCVRPAGAQRAPWHANKRGCRRRTTTMPAMWTVCDATCAADTNGGGTTTTTDTRCR